MESFSLELIKLNYFALDKKSCLTDMSEFLFQKGVISSLDEFFDVLMERESIMSTGIGRGVAIPHGRSSKVNELKILVYLLKNELDFDSIDDSPVKIVFMIAVPDHMKQEYMKVLSQISNFCQKMENLDDMFSCENRKEVFEVLKRMNL